MQAIDIQGEMAEFFFDPKRKIPRAHLDLVCQKGKKGACRYIALVPTGYVCMKHTPMKNPIDEQISQGNMLAKGDNCEGLGV